MTLTAADAHKRWTWASSWSWSLQRVPSPMPGTERRLASVRALLCKFAGFNDEGDLMACVDLELNP